MGFTSPQEVVDYIKAEEVELVDIRFTDLPGMEPVSYTHLPLPTSVQV